MDFDKLLALMVDKQASDFIHYCRCSPVDQTQWKNCSGDFYGPLPRENPRDRSQCNE